MVEKYCHVGVLESMLNIKRKNKSWMIHPSVVIDENCNSSPQRW